MGKIFYMCDGEVVARRDKAIKVINDVFNAHDVKVNIEKIWFSESGDYTGFIINTNKTEDEMDLLRKDIEPKLNNRMEELEYICFINEMFDPF